MTTHTKRFQEIAVDANNAQVELYSSLDTADLIKLIIGTHFTIEIEQELSAIGWREYSGNQHNEAWRWKKEWLSKLRDAQLLPAFYVYVKHVSGT